MLTYLWFEFSECLCLSQRLSQKMLGEVAALTIQLYTATSVCTWSCQGQEHCWGGLGCVSVCTWSCQNTAEEGCVTVWVLRNSQSAQKLLQSAGLCSVIDWALSFTSAWAALATSAKLGKAIFPFTVHLQFSIKLWSPSLQTPLSLAEVYKAGGMHFYFRSLIKFAFLGAPQGRWWSGFVCFTSCSLRVMHQKELLTQPAWSQTQVMGLFYCTAFCFLLTWQICLKIDIFPKHHQHSSKWEYRTKQV